MSNYRIELGVDRNAQQDDRHPGFYYLPGDITKEVRGEFVLSTHAQLQVGDLVSFLIFDITSIGTFSDPFDLKFLKLVFEPARDQENQSPFGDQIRMTNFVPQGQQKSVVFDQEFEAFEATLGGRPSLEIENKGLFVAQYQVRRRIGSERKDYLKDPEWVVGGGSGN